MNDAELKLQKLVLLAGFGGAAGDMEHAELPTPLRDVISTMHAADVEKILRHNGPIVA